MITAASIVMGRWFYSTEERLALFTSLYPPLSVQQKLHYPTQCLDLSRITILCIPNTSFHLNVAESKESILATLYYTMSHRISPPCLMSSAKMEDVQFWPARYLLSRVYLQPKQGRCETGLELPVNYLCCSCLDSELHDLQICILYMYLIPEWSS